MRKIISINNIMTVIIGLILYFLWYTVNDGQVEFVILLFGLIYFLIYGFVRLTTDFDNKVATRVQTAQNLIREGKSEEAVRLLEKAINVIIKKQSLESEKLEKPYWLLGTANMNVQKYIMAAYWYERTLEMRKKSAGLISLPVWETEMSIAEAEICNGKYEEGEKWYHEAEILLSQLNEETATIIVILKNNLACAYADKKKYKQAIELFEKACEIACKIPDYDLRNIRQRLEYCEKEERMEALGD